MTPEANAIQDLLADNWPWMAVVGVLAVFVIWLLVFLYAALQGAGRSK